MKTEDNTDLVDFDDVMDDKTVNRERLKVIGEALRQLRTKSHGLTLDAFSQLGMVSVRSLSYYEKGEHVPDLLFFLNLYSKGIKLDVNYLLYGKENNHATYLSEKERKIISLLRTVGKEKEVLELLDDYDY